MIATVRARARNNLLVATVNAALERELITLECTPVKDAVFEFTIGPYLVIGNIGDAGFDEVRLSVVVCPTGLGRRFADCSHLREWRRFGEALVLGWLERRTGKYLQTAMEYHGSRPLTAILAALAIKPLGFGKHPTKGGYDFHKEFEAVFGPCRRGTL